MSTHSSFATWVMGAAVVLAAACGRDTQTPSDPTLTPGPLGVVPVPSAALVAGDSGFHAGLLDPSDPNVQSLANTTQPVRWYYIMDQATQQWYIVYPPTSSVLMLDRVDQATSFGIYWKPINNYAAASSPGTQSYSDAKLNFSTVTLSPDGRTVSFGATTSLSADPDVQVLANSVQPVRWFYIMNAPTSLWYIVAPTSRAVLQLHHVDRATSFGIFWKPVNNWVASSSPSTMGFADAGNQFASLTVTADGGTVLFGAATDQASQVSLTAFPTTVYSGQSTTLTWSSSNATSCNAPWASSSATSGSNSVTPVGTTTYSITCTGSGGSVSASVVVTVLQTGALALSISGLPSGVAGNVTMTGPNSYNGQINFSVTLGNLAAGTYTIAAGPVTAGGVTYAPSPTSQQKTVVAGSTVSAGVSYSAGTAPSVTLSANPASITQGQSSTLTWSSSNATNCSAGWTGSTGTSGSQIVAPSVTTTYTITCSGSSGSKSASVVVTVNSTLTPTLSDITTVPGIVASGQSFVFALGGSNINPTNVQVVFTGPGCATTTSCVVPNGVLTSKTSGLVVGPAVLNTAGTFNVRVQNGVGGAMSNSLTVTVGSTRQMPSGWYYPNGTGVTCGYLGWLGWNVSYAGYHLAQDMCNGPAGTPVYSLGTGQILYSRTNVGGYGPGSTPGGAVIARYQAGDGTWFTVLYGHLDSPRAAGPVNGGDIIGYSNALSAPHVHLGVHVGFDPEATNPWRGYTSATDQLYGFVDPLPFLAVHRRP